MIDPLAGAVVGATAGAATQHVTEPILQRIPFVYKATALAVVITFLIWYYTLRKSARRKRR